MAGESRGLTDLIQNESLNSHQNGDTTLQLSGDCKNIVNNSSGAVFGGVLVVSLFSIDAINCQFLERL
jgi:hypothetical protein